ncbi:MAG: hypothetical protein ACXVFT_07385 [Solirubrobacteraceae bacterium]
MMLRIRVLAALTAVLSLALAAPAIAADASRTSTRGRWIVDGAGRALLARGINVVAKRPPYTPASIGFGSDDAAFLQRNGFDAVRLGVLYAGVEPRPGAYDDGYLASIARTIAVLHRHHIRALLDFHQDMYNERYQGEGFPDWAALDDGLPAEPKAGFPGNYLAMPRCSAPRTTSTPMHRGRAVSASSTATRRRGATWRRASPARRGSWATT